MKYVYEEFIKFQSNFSKEKTDFYGENSPLNKSEFKDFLKEYLAYGKRRYGEDFLCQKAVLKEEIASVLQGVNCSSDLEFFAYKRQKKSEYRNWAFYTDRASVQDNVICLKDGYAFPLPAAKYEFENGVTRLAFAVKIGSDYKAYTNRLYDTTTGRQVELRLGCADRIRLFFAPDGTLAYKNGEVDRYHPKMIKICDYDFDEWTKIELEINGSEFVIRVKGKEEKFPYPFNDLPNTLYLGGGMQPTEEWSVELLNAQDGDGKTIDLFEKETAENGQEIPLGKVRLPFVLGTQKNKDCELVLRSTFVYQNGCRSVLKIESLDPGGEVFINGKSVVRKDDFQPAVLDVTSWCEEGENALEIVVFPRAPEVLYNWHRHEDFYNGWFSLDVKIENSKRFIASEPVVKTLKTGTETKFSLSWNTKLTAQAVDYSVFLKKSYPVLGERVKLGEGTLLQGVLEREFCLPVALWEVENPNLYELEIKLFEQGEEIASSCVETGFRTIEQKEGGIYLNGKKICLNGALNMQFLPPYEDIPLTHLCPSAEQIAEQLLAVKNMNGNCLRMHQLGYGSNDKRFAKLADRLGVTLIWTTRLIDSAENLQWTDTWKQREGYLTQVRQVLNYPSVIMYEGSNELHTGLTEIDRIYKEFVSAVKSVDDTRLLCPISHLYYGGGLYENGTYYNDNGTKKEDGALASAPEEWTAEGVVRSAHTYCILLGYGSSWQDMLTQNWQWQEELFNNSERAYIVSEFAIIGRQNPCVEEAKEYFNTASYEYKDEVVGLGYSFTDDEWEISQAFQAICASATVKKLKSCGADGMLWCALWGGANNASYLKPVVDFYGYKKFAYYSLKEGFASITAFHSEPQLLWDSENEISPMLCSAQEGVYTVTVEVLSLDGEKICEKTYASVIGSDKVCLPSFNPNFVKDGYYILRYSVEEQEKSN